MGLVTLNEVLPEAYRSGYAVGAFNALNIEFGQGIIEGALLERSPVIIQVSGSAIEHSGLEVMAAAIRAMGQDREVPVVLHLDHARDPGLVERAINAGFTSVMFDGSELPFEDNVRLTKQVVEMAHSLGLSAEGELGLVPSARDRKWSMEDLREYMTDPAEARAFVEETGVDALAVSVGSVHKMLRREAGIHAGRVAEIRRVVKIPLVLHGSSGVKDDSLADAVRSGIAKVNIATALSEEFLGAIRSELGSLSMAGTTGAARLLSAGRQAIGKLVAEKIRLLGSSGTA